MTQHNLPSQATSFVGRTQEITDISTRLNEADCRLLTLLGAGGIGKTRLAIAVAEQEVSNYSDGIYYIPLQAIASAENILPTTASILNIQFHSGASPKEQFLHFLHNKQILLLMDNFEHLLDGADLIAEIVEAAPQVKILVTSREPLNLKSEWLHHVIGMHYPQTDDTDIKNYSAVKLFAERARQVRRNFSLEDERDCVAQVCRLVEGMPLGIELAAGWMKRLSCGQVVSEIEQNLDFLVTNLRGVPDRHRSIRAVFAHSWQLLSEEEQAIFMKLSVFRGGCTREAAETVADASLYLLSDLVDKSLLRLNPDGRYDIHELLRQYAEEKLDELPEIRDKVLDKHCEYYLDFIAPKVMFGWTQSVKIKQILRQDDENRMLAWQHAIDHGKLAEIQKAIVSIGAYYDRRDVSDLYHETVELLRTANPQGEQGIAFGHALGLYGFHLRFEGKYEQAIQYCQESVDILRALNAEQELIWSLTWLNVTLFMMNNFPQVQQVSEEILERAEAIDSYSSMAEALHYIGLIERMAGHYSEAERFIKRSAELLKQDSNLLYIRRNGYLAELAQLRGEYKRAQRIMKEMLPLYIEAEHNWNIGHAYEFIGHIEHALGNYTVAEENLLESLRYAREHGDPRRVTFSLVGLGDFMTGMGDYQQARQYYEDAINVAKPSSQRWQEIWALRGLGQIAYSTGDYQQAREYAEEGLTRCHEIGWKYGSVQANNVLGLVAVEQNDGEVATHYFYEALASELVTETPPVILATLYGIARLASTEGNLEQAVELLSLILADEKSHADTKHAAQYLLDELQAELSEELFKAAFERGQENDLEAVVADLQKELSNHKNKPSAITQDSLVEPLSERELEVLILVAAGKSNREIASKLYLALGTVKTHVHNISGKLGANNRTEAVAKARKHGLL